MKYKGHELKEITEPQIFDPPKKMLCWDFEGDRVDENGVIAILPRKYDCTVVTKLSDNEVAGFYRHCAEIPEETKPRWATNRELAKWLAQGNGELSQGDSPKATTLWVYEICYKDKTVPEFIFVRKWDDTEWHEPTVEYMGLEA